MATLIARADGNLTTAATWGVCSAVAAALLDSETSNTGTTTAYVESQTFTPGAVTIDGIAVKIRSRNASPSGTFSIRLAQAGATVAGTEVIVNVSDIVTDAQDEAGWFLVKFAGVLLVAATAYTVSVKSSVNAQVTLYRDATLGNWSRMIRTTTTGAPAAGDNMFVLGEWTAAATKSNRIVTMDSSATLNYGAASTTLVGFGISNGGTLTFATTVGTTFILRLAAIMGVWRGGILNMGTTSTPCPRLGGQQLQFNCAVDGDYGLKVWGTWTGQGLSRTIGKDVVQCLLSADLAAAGTTYNVNTDTGWLNGDVVAVATTTRTATQSETSTLNAGAGASSFTVSAGVANAHSGTSPTRAEVILLTRSVSVEAVTPGTVTYVFIGTAAIVDLDWVQFRYLATASSPKRGIEINTTTGSVAMSYCSLRDFDTGGIVTTGAAWNNVTIDNLVSYFAGAGTRDTIALVATTATNWSFTDVTLINATTGNYSGFNLATAGGTMTRIRCAGYGGNSGIALGAAGITTLWTDFELHGNSIGIGLTSGAAGDHVGRIVNVNTWRNSSSGISLSSRPVSVLFDGGNAFGNAINVDITASPLWVDFRNWTFAGDTTFSTTIGVRYNQANAYYRSRFDGCTFGVVTGIKAAHTTADIQLTGAAQWDELTFVNTNLASATEIQNQLTNATGQSFFSYERVDGTTNIHKTIWPTKGTVAYETTTFHTAAPSEKLTPSGATTGNKLTSGIKRARVASGGTVAFGIYVRKDATYTGNPPRFILKANGALGWTADVVLDTHSAAADTWEQLTGTTPTAAENGVAEVYVDCDGSAGNVYVDDATAA
jgi:hypothetical protein